MGRYGTFSKQDIFKDLGNAIPEARNWDTETPQVDPITPPTMTDVRDMEAKTKDRETPPGRFNHLTCHGWHQGYPSLALEKFH